MYERPLNRRRLRLQGPRLRIIDTHRQNIAADVNRLAESRHILDGLVPRNENLGNARRYEPLVQSEEAVVILPPPTR